MKTQKTKYNQTGYCFSTAITSHLSMWDSTMPHIWPAEKEWRGNLSVFPSHILSFINLYSSAIIGPITGFFKLSLGKRDTMACGLMLHLSLKMRGRASHHSWWWYNHENQQESGEEQGTRWGSEMRGSTLGVSVIHFITVLVFYFLTWVVNINKG